MPDDDQFRTQPSKKRATLWQIADFKTNFPCPELIRND